MIKYVKTNFVDMLLNLKNLIRNAENTVRRASKVTTLVTICNRLKDLLIKEVYKQHLTPNE